MSVAGVRAERVLGGHGGRAALVGAVPGRAARADLLSVPKRRGGGGRDGLPS